MNDTFDSKTDEKEIFEEIVSLLQHYLMKMYSKRKKTNWKYLI